MQHCLETEWFYFGLHFCVCKTRQADKAGRVLPLRLFKENISGDMAEVIQKDLRTLRSHAVGGKSSPVEAGRFVRP